MDSWVYKMKFLKGNVKTWAHNHIREQHCELEHIKLELKHSQSIFVHMGFPEAYKYRIFSLDERKAYLLRSRRNVGD